MIRKLDDCTCLCDVADELRYDVLDKMPPGPQADRLRRLVEQVEAVADFIVQESDRQLFEEVMSAALMSSPDRSQEPIFQCGSSRGLPT